MIGTEEFLEPPPRPNLPPDDTISGACWASLPLSERVAYHLSDILIAADDIRGMLARELPAARNGVEPTLDQVMKDVSSVMERLAC